MQQISRFFKANILFALALVFVSPTTTFGQEDPATDDENREVIQLGKSDRELRIDDTAELLIRSVAQSNPTTPVQVAKAAGLMIEIKQYDEAKKYLDMLAKLPLEGEASYRLNRTVGSDLFYEFARTTELQPEGRELALKVFKSASLWANSEERIDGLIKQLANDDDYARGDAFAKLNRVGKKAIARVIETFANQEREDDFPALRGALYAFGKSALGPLLGAAEASHPSVRVEAIRGLAKLDSNRAVDMLLRTNLSMKTESPYRELAGYYLSKAGRTPKQSTIAPRFCERIKRYLDGRKDSAESLLGSVEIWNWNPDTDKLEVSEVESSIAARMRAADLAQTLFEMNPEVADYRQLHLLTQLESRKRRAGYSQSIDVDEYLQQAPNIGPTEMEGLLLKAVEIDLIPAATAACEVLKKIGTEAQLIGSQRRPLVDAILVGDRHLQFAAFDAIAEINPGTAYAGSSYVAELAAYLASSRFVQKCAVGHSQNQATQAWTAAVGPRGWASLAANSGNDFFENVAADPDVGILVISDTIRHPHHRELVQQIRSHWKTKRMPIALLASSPEKLIKSVRYTEGFDRLVTFPISLDRSAIELQLDQLEAKVSPWVVSSDDRFRHAARAVEWLEKAAVDPNLSFYNLANHQQQMLGLLYHPEFTASAANILATQPTASAQRTMLGFVSQGDLPIESREMVADAFEAAVKRGGTMLTTREIELQYERYNASEGQPEETQKVLGRVLDVIEARRDGALRD
jgi:CheY-like chemotaxis protein